MDEIKVFQEEAREYDETIIKLIPFYEQMLDVTILVLNIMDEARKQGIHIDSRLLEKELGIAVVEAVSTTGEGIDRLRERIKDYAGI